MSWFQIQFDLDNLVFEESDLAALFDDQYPVTADAIEHAQSDSRSVKKPEKSLEAFFSDSKA